MSTNIFDEEIKLLKQTQENYHKLTNYLIEKRLSITVMESCTSGLVASFITDTNNSSRIFKGSLVTYSNDDKIANGVDEKIINEYGVYSKQTSMEMAKAVKEKYKTNISIGITGSLGIADPNNIDSKPGEVYFTIDYIKPKTYFVNFEDKGSKYINKLYTVNSICIELLKVLDINNLYKK